MPSQARYGPSVREGTLSSFAYQHAIAMPVLSWPIIAWPVPAWQSSCTRLPWTPSCPRMKSMCIRQLMTPTIRGDQKKDRKSNRLRGSIPSSPVPGQATSTAASSPTALPTPAAATAATISSSPTPARAAASAPPAPPGVGSKPPPIWSITSARPCRSGNGCSRSRNGCAITLTTPNCRAPCLNAH